MNIKDYLKEEGADYYMTEDGDVVIDCGGCDFEFLRVVNLIVENLEQWTYEDLKALKIAINTAYEKVTIRGEIECR